ncbi:MAG: choline/carnitine O-acyltransferase [Propionibacteriaceae bacterium]|nr:choline/carnitine O-acyltransferase [Propionibacteriaceae bacterium]
MKSLPVPSLPDTLDRYLEAVSPLLSAEEFTRTRAVVEAYAGGPGPLAQAELERFAAQEAEAGRSWLSEAWLAGYLTVRAPLPLSTSVGFRVAWPVPARSRAEALAGGTPGLALAAEVLHGFAGSHLAYLRGDIPPELTPRGDEIDTSQRTVIAGGIRHPHPDADRIRPGEWDARDREVGVLWHGRWFAVPVSDAAGALRPRAELQAVLARIVADDAPAESDLTALSYLGADRAAAGLDRLLAEPSNRRTYDRIARALFALCLDDTALSAAEEETEFIRRVAFEPGHAWTGKPLTYQVQLRHGLVALHMEHSLADGGTLTGIVTGAHRVRDETGPGAPDEAAGIAVEAPEELAWVLPAGLHDEIEEELAAYRDRAAPLHVQLVRVPAPVPPGVKVSGDAILQWIMLFAQRATYGRVRSTYEAVDMREYLAGRTECLRSNTREAVALVEALLDDAAAAEPGLVDAALTAHRTWVKNAKAGHGVDRHLLGLKLAAERLGQPSPLHDDEGWRRLTTDFLSTTSLGTREAILRCAFAPTSTGGIGVYYVADGEELEFSVIHRRDEAERVAEFVANLSLGAERLAAALGAWAAVG